MSRTPLEEWIMSRTGYHYGDEGGFLEHLDSYRLKMIKETLSRAKSASSFYSEKLSGVFPEKLKTLSDFTRLPLTTPEEIKEQGLRMVCVPQDSISRIVTLPTSGTTDNPKRIFFTEEDQELTIDFFHHGMSTFTEEGDKVLILMPGERPGSVGDLLCRGLARLGAMGIVHGPVLSLKETWNRLDSVKPQVIVGFPRQVGALVKYAMFNRYSPPALRAVLLSADYVPESLASYIENHWNCPVHEHYGMTEMGLGGGVTCSARNGYHTREADLLVEILDPDTGSPAKDGTAGEVVFTTLTRKGMPLIRYRTGDIAKRITGPCACGSSLDSLGRIAGRLEGGFTFSNGLKISASAVDELLLGRSDVMDYTGLIKSRGGNEVLEIHLKGLPFLGESAEIDIREELLRGLCFPSPGRRSVPEIWFFLETDQDRFFPGAVKGIFKDLRRESNERF